MPKTAVERILAHDRPSALARLMETVLELWPSHEGFLSNSFAARSPLEREDSFLVAEIIEKIKGGSIESLCRSYVWLCEQFLEEQLHFVREGGYRFNKLSEVQSFVYDNPDYMTRYMDGLLLSQVLWSNHLRVLSFFVREFLSGVRPGSSYLEIGPGHGLYVYLAAQSKNIGEIAVWDISPTSLRMTQDCLEKLQIASRVHFELRDAADNRDSGDRYNAVVISEVIEHLENPAEFLSRMVGTLASDGQVFINVPVNSPAPDHIYLLKSPEAAVELVRSAGLIPIRTAFYPESGLTLEQARAREATISCVVVAKPASIRYEG